MKVRFSLRSGSAFSRNNRHLVKVHGLHADENLMWLRWLT